MTQQRKQLALVLTGHLRCWKTVYPNIKQQFIDRYDTEVFIESWENEGYWVSPEADKDKAGVNLHSPPVNPQEVLETYNPRGLVLQIQDSVKNEIQQFADKLQPLAVEIRAFNVVSQFFKILMGYHQLRTYVDASGTNFDWVLRMRPDLIIDTELPNLNDLNWSDIHTLRHPNHEGNGTGDMFLLANYQNSMMFAESLSKMDVIAEHLKRFCPHIITKHIIDRIAETDSLINHVEWAVNKTLQHTPNGQYNDWK